MRFLVARNPDPDSRLPYLVQLPIGGGLVLKVRDTWPRTSRVFCARTDGTWPDDAEILDEATATICRRRGVAIDLVLDRPRENRSQFVFTTLPSGREGIFWQTRKVVGTARPPASLAAGRAASQNSSSPSTRANTTPTTSRSRRHRRSGRRWVPATTR